MNLSWHVHAANETMERIELAGIDPLAICNDGTSASYLWKKSPNGSNKWLIMLAGGGACWDEASCKHRSEYNGPPKNHLFSSENQPNKDRMGGIFSPRPEESPMWDANKAIMHHCSSDYFLG